MNEQVEKIKEAPASKNISKEWVGYNKNGEPVLITDFAPPGFVIDFVAELRRMGYTVDYIN